MKSNLAVVHSTHKTDAELKDFVLTELKYEPSVKAADIGVIVQDGILTLTGSVASYGDKWAAVRASKRIAGINAIADEIEVKLPSAFRHDDSDIAKAAASQIKWSPSLPDDKIKVTVTDGWITLEGTLDWWYERKVAENAVKYLSGVKGVTNQIVIKPQATSSRVDSDIMAAFERNALLEAKKIKASVFGSEVTLKGEVRTHIEKEEAERVAYAAPGVSSVKNDITVEWSWLAE